MANTETLDRRQNIECTDTSPPARLDEGTCKADSLTIK